MKFLPKLFEKKWGQKWGQANLFAILQFINYGPVSMARKRRVHFVGALYHVMCRGNQGQSIFKDDRDRERYLDLLKESQRRFGYRLYAYVLMGNHVLCGAPHNACYVKFRIM